MNIVATYRHTFYDYGCLLYLAVRYIGKKYFRISLPKANLWASSGMLTCTEWVTHVLTGKQDSLVTPYQLFLRLKGHGV